MFLEGFFSFEDVAVENLSIDVQAHCDRNCMNVKF